MKLSHTSGCEAQELASALEALDVQKKDVIRSSARSRWKRAAACIRQELQQKASSEELDDFAAYFPFVTRNLLSRTPKKLSSPVSRRSWTRPPVLDARSRTYRTHMWNSGELLDLHEGDCSICRL